MREKTPTAEEVLGLLSTACDSYNSEPFITAYQQWQAAQGPVTREWFTERFGNEFATGLDAAGNDWAVTGPDADGYVLMETEDAYGAVTIKLHNPTRSKIEALVEMLGGEA